MSLRKHRDRAIGKRIKSHRMPKVDEQKLGTKIHEEDKDNKVEAIQCVSCGSWFNSDDLENGLCFKCIKKDSSEVVSEVVSEIDSDEINLEDLNIGDN